MAYRLDFSEQARKDISYHRKAGNRAVLKKLLTLLEEIADHPFEGTGKPEILRHDLSGCWSRRINKEHRLVYEVFENHIRILSARGHYK
ncbi:Txe/YoeB family addiction module toxin [Persicitalea jodogahamensis]|uniref:Txe/YoeB family addiction module toxin n=1 Tax=Persicitalea jodogahamensis TaxID=402147 RepID=UPI00167BF94B|nr:Txe/YoeB family addiction module toxin [Persicitalea jodogahamensis]